MPDDYRISDLTTAPSIGNSDLMELSVVNTSSESGYSSMKTPVTGLANKIVNGIQYVADLETTAKTITGAINELAQGGGGGGGDADVIKTASGSIASFTTNLETKLPALKANFLCSGGNGTPSTPIPLVPLTELNVTRTGVNIWDEEWEEGYYNWTTGVKETSSLRIRNKNVIAVTPAITVFNSNSGYAVDYFFYDQNGLFVQPIYKAAGNQSIVVPNDCYYMNFSVYATYGNVYHDDISINYPSTDTSYHAYNGQTITLDLDGTRYGGYVDANNGKLVVTWVGAIYDGSDDENWQMHGSGSASAFAMRSAIVIDNINTDGIILANELEGISRSATWGNYDEWVSVTADKQIVTGIQSITDVNTWKTWLSSHNLEVAYELATPIEVDITPAFLSAIVGQNNVFHDGNGDVELSYFTDLAGDIKNFINADVGLDDLDDVVITSPSANQVLKYDGNKWVNGTGGGGASDLDDLGDVEITTPSNDQVLKYDSASQKWVNGNASGGSAHNYSTTEHEVGTWIDGSPIYERTVALPNKATASGATALMSVTDLSDLNIISSNVIGMETIARSVNGSPNAEFLDNVYSKGNYETGLSLFFAGGVLYYQCRYSNSNMNFDLYLTFRYTKSI